MGAFQIYAPLAFFEKASAGEDKRMRIAGVISTEKLDKQGEVVIQKGLDFSPFLSHGWFNDNHKKGTDDVLGYPTSVSRFQKGEKLPDGTIATSNGTWAEGYLVNSNRGRSIWDLGMGLAKAGGDRRLGFSIEGNVTKRSGPDRKTIAKATVTNTAITNCPVGMDTRLECLIKSLDAAEAGEEEDEGEDDIDKALSATGGPAAAPGQNPSTQGPTTGEGAGRILAGQSLEDEERDVVTKSEAIATIMHRFPGTDASTAERAYRTLSTLAEQNLLFTGRDMEKSALQKGLDALTAAAEAGNPAVRKNELMAKASAGTITSDENEELIKSLQGDSDDVTAPFTENSSLQKSLDVSEYLRENNNALLKSLDAISSRVDSQEQRQRDFDLALAKSVVGLGDLVKSMADQIAEMSGQPASAPRSVGVRADDVVQKGFAGQAPQGVQLSKSQVLDVMESISEANNGFSKSGESMATAIAKYEGGNEISPSLAAEIKAHHVSSQAA